MSLYIHIICCKYDEGVDKEAPRISACPANISSPTDLGKPTALVIWDDLTVTDNTDDDPAINCTTSSGSEFIIGVTEVVCEAIDKSGNNATCSFNVNVTGQLYYTISVVYHWCNVYLHTRHCIQPYTFMPYGIEIMSIIVIYSSVICRVHV